jgi:hypothetical protein
LGRVLANAQLPLSQGGRLWQKRLTGSAANGVPPSLLGLTRAPTQKSKYHTARTTGPRLGGRWQQWLTGRGARDRRSGRGRRGNRLDRSAGRVPPGRPCGGLGPRCVSPLACRGPDSSRCGPPKLALRDLSCKIAGHECQTKAGAVRRKDGSLARGSRLRVVRWPAHACIPRACHSTTRAASAQSAGFHPHARSSVLAESACTMADRDCHAAAASAEDPLSSSLAY